MTSAHKHADLITAWANGSAIQFYSKKRGKWLRANNPTWKESTKYRLRKSDKVQNVNLQIITDAITGKVRVALA